MRGIENKGADATLLTHRERIFIMLWFIFVVLFSGSAVWVLLFSGKLKKSAATGSGIKKEEKSFVIPEDRPFVFSRKVEKSEFIKAEIKESDIKKMPIYFQSDGEKFVKFPHKPGSENINISNVTKELISAIMEMSKREKYRLMLEKSGDEKGAHARYNPKTTTKQAIEMIMRMSLEDRCRLLGEYKARKGVSRRKFPRKEYVAPIYFAGKGILLNEFTKNISKCGVFIETLKAMDLKFIPGDPITMNFEHPHVQKNIKIQGKIARVTQKSIGVRFDEPLQNMK